MFSSASPLQTRFLAAGVRLAISGGIALLAALLIFGLWFPYPYREMSGGIRLFLMLMAIDMVVGPLLTFAVFNRLKPLKELRRDLFVIGLLQLGVLGYGLWTVTMARPVHLVFEIDRFRVVHAVDVPPELLVKAPPELRGFSLAGPTLLSVRDFRNAEESLEFTVAALQGLHLGARPELWATYEAAKPQVLAAAKPLETLIQRFPEHFSHIETALKNASSDDQRSPVSFVPMASRDTFWTVLINANTAEVIAFVPIDSF